MMQQVSNAGGGILQQYFLSSAFRSACLRNTKQLSTLPVITVPKLIQHNLEKRKKSEERKDLAKRLEVIRRNSRKGNKDVCLVRCKDHRLNHYLGQSYDKLRGVQLASSGWKHGKAKGDYFTICSRPNTGPAAAPTQPDPDPDRDPDTVADGVVFVGGAAAAAKPPPSSAPTFADLQLHPDIVDNLRRQGITTPTPIQRRAIPRLLSGGGALVAAETGCGKTLAYLVPLVERLYRQRLDGADHGEPARNRPHAIVITPGRELACQIKDVAVNLTRGMPLRTRILIGGRTKKKMMNPTLLEMDILVATFGALSKFTTTGIVDLTQVSHVVLDEADTLLDDSFRDDVRRLLLRLPLRDAVWTGAEAARPATALTLVGATLPRSVDRLLDGLVTGDVLANITTAGLHRLMPHVQQKFCRLGSVDRPAALVRLCKQALDNQQPVIVFSNNSQTSDWVSLYLNEHGVDCMNVNGRMHYKLRQGRWDAFTSGVPSVLSCTDMVSRGLDSTTVHHVVNYDFPWNTSDYIHRAGRVGRLGGVATGHVTSFVCRPIEVDMAQRIEKAARLGEALWNVDANIKQIIEKRMLRKTAMAESRQGAARASRQRS